MGCVWFECVFGVWTSEWRNGMGKSLYLEVWLGVKFLSFFENWGNHNIYILFSGYAGLDRRTSKKFSKKSVVTLPPLEDSESWPAPHVTVETTSDEQDDKKERRKSTGNGSANGNTNNNSKTGR